eukprot:4784402-Prymnesium_polylepis.3
MASTVSSGHTMGSSAPEDREGRSARAAAANDVERTPLPENIWLGSPVRAASVSGSEASAACQAAASWKARVSAMPRRVMPSVAARSCCTFTPVAARPGSAAMAAPTTPAAARRRLRARTRRQSPAFESEYCSHGLEPCVWLSSLNRAMSRALKRAEEECATMRTSLLERSRGSSSCTSSACASRLTCMITSSPSDVQAKSSREPPPRPALRQSTSSVTPVLTMWAPNSRTEARDARSRGTSGTRTTASGTALRIASAAPFASCASSPGRAGSRIAMPTVASSLAA